MNCNYCRLPEHNEPAFDVLQKMIELERSGVNVNIMSAMINGTLPAFRVCLRSGGVEIVKYINHYNAPFMESVIDEMLKDLKKGAAL